MKRILVTGATGFVGRAVIKTLLEKEPDAELHGVYNNSVHAESTIHWHRADLLNQDSRRRLISDIKPNYLIHLAWTSAPGIYWTDVNNVEWVKASLDIARLFAEQGGERCLYCGSSAEYEWSKTKVLSESDRTAPLSLYGSSKLAVLQVASQLFQLTNVSWSWVRLFNPFGPGEHPRRLIPRVCQGLINDKHLDFDAAQSVRDFLHVDDVADALATILCSDLEGVVNVGSGEATRIRDIIEQIGRYYGRNHLIHFNDHQSDSGDSIVAEVHRLRAELKWQPAKSLNARINETCGWWLNQKIQSK